MTLRMMRGLAMNSGSVRGFKHHNTGILPDTMVTSTGGDDIATQPLQECVRHGTYQPHWKICHHCLSEK